MATWCTYPPYCHTTGSTWDTKSSIVIPPGAPGVPTHPIVIPPGESGVPIHPIVIPPGEAGVPIHPIAKPPKVPERPNHPIGITPEQPGAPLTPEISPNPQIRKYRPIHKVARVQNPTITSLISSASKDKVGLNLTQTAPITQARQFDEGAWNIWSDNYYLGIRDDRNNVNTKGRATNFVIGTDRHISNKLVGGFSLAAIQLNTTAFGNSLENNVKGYKLGPYFGYQISSKWAIDGSLNYGQFQNQNTILTLNSEYVTKLINATLHSTRVYQFGNFQIRPQPLISYTYFKNPTYHFNGTVNNSSIQITRDTEHFAVGLAEFKLEGNYTKKIKNGDLLQPYTEIGVDYAFIQPTTDQVVSGNLALANTPKNVRLIYLRFKSITYQKIINSSQC